MNKKYQINGSDVEVDAVGQGITVQGEDKNRRAIVNKLFDRFVNLEFEKFWSLAEAENEFERQKNDPTKDRIERNALINSVKTQAGWNKWVRENSPKVRIETPIRGIKPDISVSATFLPSHKTTQVTVTVKNLEIELDISDFAFMSVALGYSGSAQVAFRGAIMNSYVETPNPNGKTVFQMLDGAHLSDTLYPRRIVLEGGPKGLPALQCVVALCDALKLIFYDSNNENWGYTSIQDVDKYSIKYKDDGTLNWSRDWQGGYTRIPLIQPYHTKEFGSAQECLNWIEDAFRSMNIQANEKDPVNWTIEKMELRNTIYGIELFIGKDAYAYRDNLMARLDYVTSASFTGGGITVVAPYNPAIQPLKPFMIDPKYFRGRFNGRVLRENELANSDMQGKTGPGISDDARYTCTQLQIDFGTYSGNTMKITGVMRKGQEENELLARAVADAKNATVDELGVIFPPPFFTPSGFAEGVAHMYKDELFTPPDTLMLTEDEYFDLYTYYEMKEGDTLAKVFGRTIATWCLDRNLYWQNEDFLDTTDPLILYGNNPGEVTWNYDKPLAGVKVYYPKWLEEGGFWKPGEKGVTVEGEGTFAIPDCYELRRKVLNRIVVTATSRQVFGHKYFRSADEGQESITEILDFYGRMYQKEKGVPLIENGVTVDVMYGYDGSNAEDVRNATKKDVNIALDKCTDYFDLYVYMVEYAPYRAIFGAQSVYSNYAEMIAKNRELIPGFYLSGFTGAICTMITQNRWWREDGKKETQLMGYDGYNQLSDTATILYPKKDKSSIKLTISFPDFVKTFTDKEKLQSISNMLGELVLWSAKNYRYKGMADDLISDQIYIEQLMRALP